MPRSCPPLRSDGVGWHGRRVRTRLRLILERVFWFVNGGMSGGVGGDGMESWLWGMMGSYVRIHAPHLDSGAPGDLSTVHNRVSACAPDGQPQSPGAKTLEQLAQIRKPDLA